MSAQELRERIMKLLDRIGDTNVLHRVWLILEWAAIK